MTRRKLVALAYSLVASASERSSLSRGTEGRNQKYSSLSEWEELILRFLGLGENSVNETTPINKKKILNIIVFILISPDLPPAFTLQSFPFVSLTLRGSRLVPKIMKINQNSPRHVLTLFSRRAFEAGRRENIARGEYSPPSWT